MAELLPFPYIIGIIIMSLLSAYYGKLYGNFQKEEEIEKLKKG